SKLCSPTRFAAARPIEGDERMRGYRSSIFLIALAVAVGGFGAARPAHAYRPFDGTDAAVADEHEVEIEVGPAGLRRDDDQRTVIAPAIVVNYGFAHRWEAVLQGRGEFPYAPHRDRSGLRDNALLLKGVLRDGVLQGAAGPSIATEFGALLPD